MAQIMIDLKKCERKNQLLEEHLLIKMKTASKQNVSGPPDNALQNISAAFLPAASDENNNNWQNLGTNSVLNSLIVLSNIVLDPDVENIIQFLPDDVFCCYFSLDKFMVRCLLVEMRHRVYYHPLNDMDHAISFDKSVLVTLSYLSNGHYDNFQTLKYFELYSSEQLKHCVQRTCQIFVHFLSPDYLRFPCSQEEQHKVKSGFLRHFGVPGIVGVMECYYALLDNVPQHQQHMYMRSHFTKPSLAVQLICDQNYRFLDVNPRFSGGTSKIHVWRNSNVYHIVNHARKTEPNTWLIANGGYHSSSVVINPYHNACGNQDVSVNLALMEVQLVVDQAFALLRLRFKCLSYCLPFSHEHAANIITTCVTLHNYLLEKCSNNE